MKRKPAITIQMSAAHWPTLDLGVHLPDGAEGVGWRAQAGCDGRVLQVQRGPGRPKRPQRLIGESLARSLWPGPLG